MIFQMDVLKFGLLCIDFLAWPMLALAYPLCASIRAIETGSKYHMKKLVTYWTVFSIISLFEHTLRVMEWVPLWPFIKLVGTFWLVIPQFNGACYAYDCLVNADLSAKLHCFLSQFSHGLCAQEQLSEDFKAMEQTTEQGTEETKFIDFKTVEQTIKQGIAEERKVESEVDNIGEIQKQEVDSETTWLQGIPVLNAAEEKIIPAEINSSKLIQREWTCAVCQVTTTSEIDLKFHLRGQRHRTKWLELKSSKRVTKDLGSSSSKATDTPNQAAKHASAGGSKQETNVKPEKAKGLPNQVKNEPAKHAATGGESKQKTSGKQEKVQANASSIKEKQTKENVSVSADPKLYCSICNIWCGREADMGSHLNGRKHLSNLKETGVMKVNEPVKHTPSGGGSKQENVKPEKATGFQYQVKNEPANPTPAGGSKQKTKVQANASDQNVRKAKENNASVSTDSRLYCAICNIWCPGEAGFVSHLTGRKHLSKLKQMGILMG